MVRLTPNAALDARQELVAASDGAPPAGDRSQGPTPVPGAAHAALGGYPDKALNLRKSDVMIVSGETARSKRLEIAQDSTALVQRLTALMAEAG
jgi:hypothetical protein